jgi:hypothetical protein
MTVGTDVELAFKIETSDETEYEGDATSGTFHFEQWEGAPGEDGVVIPDNEGSFGGFFTVTLDDGAEFSASFTANCGENDMGD